MHILRFNKNLTVSECIPGTPLSSISNDFNSSKASLKKLSEQNTPIPEPKRLNNIFI